MRDCPIWGQPAAGTAQSCYHLAGMDDDSPYITPKVVTFDSGIGSGIGMSEMLAVMIIVSFVVAAWVFMGRVRLREATRADVGGFLPRKRKRRRSSRRSSG